MRVVNGITSQLPVLPDPRSFARGLVEDYAATRIDLMALGVSDRIARTVTQAYAPRTLEEDKHQVVPPMPSGSPEICAIVPTDELGRAYLAQRAYLRDSALAQPVRLGATHIATNRGEQIAEIYPIITRYRLGSIRALSTLASSTAQRVRAMPETSEQWDGPLTYFELGVPVPLGLPLGYKKTGLGTPSGIVRVLHYHLSVLRHLANTGGVLRGAPGA